MSGVQQTAQARGGAGQATGGAGAGQDVVARMRAVGQSVEEIFRIFQAMPGVDQQKVAQARAMFQQSVQILISSKGGGQ